MATKSNKTKKAEHTEPEKKVKTKAKNDLAIPLKSKIKHTKVIQRVVENGGNLSKAMRDEGYSDAYAKNPQKLKNAKSFKALLDYYLPEGKLLDIHEQQLKSWKLQSMLFQKQVEDEDIFDLMETVGCLVKKVVEIPTGKLVFYIQPDNQSRNKALEMALKLHKRLTDKVEIRDTTPYAQLSDAELAEKIKKGKQFFTKKSPR